jgi:hypothetical protein
MSGVNKHINTSLFSATCLLVFFFACIPAKKMKPDLSKTEFIYIQNGEFKHHRERFFPVMLNYVVGFRELNGKVVMSPIKEYEDPETFENNNSDSTSHQLQGHLRLIKEMGFNTIRLAMDRVQQDKGRYYYPSDNKWIYVDKDCRKLIAAIHDFLKLAEKEKLRVMLLIKPPYDNESLNLFTKDILKSFRNEPVLFAYDFFNEPLYFDTKTDDKGNAVLRPKEEVVSIVNDWRMMVDNYAPSQMLTIGFSEPIEVFKWDPSILPVDFVAFHTYNPLRVINEIYWYSNYSQKPWMIGETALPADGDSISYDEQTLYYREVLQSVLKCGGIGIGWWEFQEIPNTHFEAQYTGILNHKGETITKSGGYHIKGTVKPMVKEVLSSSYAKQERICPCMKNYENMLGYENYLIKGLILDDETSKPIEGAVIRGWNADWSIGQNTFSRKDGSFNLFSNDKCIHFEMSAPGYSNSKFDANFTYKWLAIKNKLKKLANTKIEYHSISYKDFLVNKKQSVLKFKSGKFNRYKTWSQMKPVLLKKLQTTGF